MTNALAAPSHAARFQFFDFMITNCPSYSASLSSPLYSFFVIQRENGNRSTARIGQSRRRMRSAPDVIGLALANGAWPPHCRSDVASLITYTVAKAAGLG
jgi:hypothetical protein